MFGEYNAHIKQVEKALDVSIATRGHELTINGNPDKIKEARQVLEALWSRLLQGQEVSPGTVDSAIRFLKDQHAGKNKKGNGTALKEFSESTSAITTRKRTIRARSPKQALYIQGMQSKILTFGIGPAGTGKTYLAVAEAVSKLEKGDVERIILTRPAIEAGERIGFLPGEMKEKMDPYMRPLYDALHDSMYADKLMKSMASEEIEIAPLAFMRGRTLNNAFVILDEAQNATHAQMLMILTRLGENSHMVVTGDPSQTDLPDKDQSGLIQATKILKDVENTAFIKFESDDVVRSKMVAQIIKAYDAYKGS